MPQVGFEPTISAGERPQTYALERAATGTGEYIYIYIYIYTPTPPHTHTHTHTSVFMNLQRLCRGQLSYNNSFYLSEYLMLFAFANFCAKTQPHTPAVQTLQLLCIKPALLMEAFPFLYPFCSRKVCAFYWTQKSPVNLIDNEFFVRHLLQTFISCNATGNFCYAFVPTCQIRVF